MSIYENGAHVSVLTLAFAAAQSSCDILEPHRAASKAVESNLGVAEMAESKFASKQRCKFAHMNLVHVCLLLLSFVI